MFYVKRFSVAEPQFVTTLQSAVPGTAATFPIGAGGGLLQAGDILAIQAGNNNSGGAYGSGTYPPGFTELGFINGHHPFGSDAREFSIMACSVKVLTAADLSGGNLAAAITTAGYTSQFGVVLRIPGTSAINVTSFGSGATDSSGAATTAQATGPLSQIPAGTRRASLTFGRAVATIPTFTGETGGTLVDHTGLTGNSGVAPYGDMQIVYKTSGPSTDFVGSITTAPGGMWSMIMAGGIYARNTPVAATFIAHAEDNTLATSSTFGPFTVPTDGLLVIAGGSRRGGSAHAMSSVTVDGAATLGSVLNAAALNNSFIVWKEVTAGSRSVTVNWTAAKDQAGVAVYLLTGYTSPTPVSINAPATATAASGIATLDTPGTGPILGGAMAIYAACHANLNATTWSGATEDSDVTGGTAFALACAHKAGGAPMLANVETASWTGSVLRAVSGALWT